MNREEMARKRRSRLWTPNEQQRDDKPERIVATPWTWRDPSTIPPRRWLYGKHYIRKFLSTTVAPGGAGKSSLVLVEALSMVTARRLLGEPQSEEPLRVWYYNGEDPREEIDRRVAAICKHFNITSTEIGGRLYVNSGRDTPIIVAARLRDQTIITIPVIEALTREIREKGIDCAIIDPFISTHDVSENDNGAIDQVASAYADVADETNIALELAHHTRKLPPGGDGDRTVDDGRGASALVNKARSARVLNVMSKTDAGNAGVELISGRCISESTTARRTCSRRRKTRDGASLYPCLSAMPQGTNPKTGFKSQPNGKCPERSMA
jgi:hypothetical protein